MLFLLLLTSLFNAVVCKPDNIILVLTDDQDVSLGGLIPMSQTNDIVTKMGTIFNNAFSTTPICCPARSSLLTGLYQHSHRVFNNSRSGGCDGKIWQDVWEHRSLGPVLQSAGYRTFYAGKYLNQYNGDRVPPGWNWWAGLKGNSVYYNYTLNVNGTKQEFGDKKEDYLTDVLTGYALDFLRVQDDRPFFLFLAPPAPHEPFTPSEKYKKKFAKLKGPRYPNFNVGGAGKHWLVRSASILPSSVIQLVDETFRNRWATLLSVDDMVAAVTSAAPSNTFSLFTSDHGFHMGQYSQAWDKRQPYETDIRVPFLVWGPGTRAGAILPHPVLNIDIAPTIYEIANINSPFRIDGVSFLSTLKAPPLNWQRSFLIEYNGEGGGGAACFQDDQVKLCSQQLACNCFDARNNTFLCSRHLSPNSNTITCQFRDKEKFMERYDLNVDPYQLNNLLFSP